MNVPASIAAAVRALQAGEVVAFPTETVYGLGADANRSDAVAKIFELKGRPQDHPLIVHIAHADGIANWAREIPSSARLLTERFWPGPLTLVLNRASHVLDAVTGGQTTIGLRCPAHPLAKALLQACAQVGISGLAAPSANRFGHVSPTTAAHVRAELGNELIVLDGGACQVGIESTIVDISTDQPRILRPGMISEDAIAAALQTNLATPNGDVPRVSGSLVAHYSPRTPLEVITREGIAVRAQVLAASGLRIVALLREIGPVLGIASISMPRSAAEYAQRLYASLREADAVRADRILVEASPANAEWIAIHDRLQRASAGGGRIEP